MISIKRILLFIFNRNLRKCILSYERALRYAVWRKDYSKAIKEYKSILENDDCEHMKANVYGNLGETYWWNGDIQEAEIALRKSLELKMKRKGHDAYLYKLLGDVLMKTGQYEEAL